MCAAGGTRCGKRCVSFFFWDIMSVPRTAAAALVALLLVGAGNASSVYDFEASDLESGLPVPLSYYRGKVLLVVNVASQCGYTDASYSMLNKLHDRYAKRGLRILAFPCNDFGGQEPGTDDEIFKFATRRKGAKFDLFRKVEVQGKNQHPLFRWLIFGEAGPGSCRDDEGSCAAWAQSGECEKNEAFMKASCRLSCKLCKPTTAGQNPLHPMMNYGQPVRLAAPRLPEPWEASVPLCKSSADVRTYSRFRRSNGILRPSSCRETASCRRASSRARTC